MLTINQGIRLSAIIEKLDLDVKVTKIEDGKDVELTEKELGIDLFKQAISKAYKAGNEIRAFVAETKGCSIEEAGKTDLVEFFKELATDTGIKDFFTSVLKLQPPG